MSDHIQKTIDDALEELKKQEDSVLTTKKLINQLCMFGKRELMFPEADQAQASAPKGGFRRNQFYGQPLATCVGDYLAWRHSSGKVKEATLDEILVALKEGGFDLGTISKDHDGQKRGVAITLAKNTTKFHRLPNGDFGLMVWYPNVKAKKEKAGDNTPFPLATEKPVLAANPAPNTEEIVEEIG